MIKSCTSQGEDTPCKSCVWPPLYLMIHAQEASMVRWSFWRDPMPAARVFISNRWAPFLTWAWFHRAVSKQKYLKNLCLAEMSRIPVKMWIGFLLGCYTRNDQDTSHRWYMWISILSGSPIRVSNILLCLATFYTSMKLNHVESLPHSSELHVPSNKFSWH